MAGCAGDSGGSFTHVHCAAGLEQATGGGGIVGTSSGSPDPAPAQPHCTSGSCPPWPLRLPEVATAGSVGAGVQADAPWPSSLVSVGVPVASDKVVVAVAEQGRSICPLSWQMPSRHRSRMDGQGAGTAWCSSHPHASCGLGQGVDGGTAEPDPGEQHLLPTPRPRGHVAVPLQARGGGSLLKHSPWGDSP